MNVEERIGRSLDRGLDRLDAGSGDLATVTALGRPDPSAPEGRSRAGGRGRGGRSSPWGHDAPWWHGQRPDPAPPVGGTWRGLRRCRSPRAGCR